MTRRLIDACQRLADRLDNLSSWLERQADELETMCELRAARLRRRTNA